jgi:hypothetical protein
VGFFTPFGTDIDHGALEVEPENEVAIIANPE